MDRKILQLIPATGFRAVYSAKPGEKTADFDVPIACFALVEEAENYDIETKIIPMILADSFDDAESDNFLGCVWSGYPKESVGSIVIEYGRGDSQLSKIIRKVEDSR